MATNCDITEGLLQPECLKGQAGIKTVFFFRHTSLQVTYNIDGEIDSIGTGTVFRFDQDSYHGTSTEEPQTGEAGESSFVQQQVDMTMFFIDPAFRETIDFIRRGRWAIFCLDYHGNIKLYGEQNAMKQIGGAVESGTAPGDNLYSSLVFEGVQNDYARFLAPFTTFPFDNMTGILVTPRYDNDPGLVLQNIAGDHILIDTSGNKLDHN